MNTFVLRNIKYDSSIAAIMAWCIGVLSKETNLITLQAKYSYQVLPRYKNDSARNII